jgi:hypothetical protein
MTKPAFTNPHSARPTVGPHHAPQPTQPQDPLPGTTGERIPNPQHAGQTAQAKPTPPDSTDG